MKKILNSLLIISLCFLIVGCTNNQEENNSSSNQGNNTNNNSSNTNKNSEFLTISENKGQYENDLPLGLETNNLKVNGNEVVVRIQTSGSSKQQANGPYYIYYNVYVGGDSIGLNCVRDAIYHLEGFGIEMLKEFDEEDIGVNHEFFEWDFTSSVIKGSDKEYVAISIPAGIEDKNQASLMLTTDNGKLLGELIVDVIHDTTLTGPEVEKYKNHSNDVVFNSIKNGNITYLTPTSSNKENLDSSLDVIELEEHSVTISNNKVIDTKTNNIYKIENAKGKTYNFSEFRYVK